MSFLNPRQRATLTAILDTLAPRLEPEAGDSPVVMDYSPLDYDLQDRLEEALERVTDADAQRELKGLLSAFDIAPVNGLLAGKWRGFKNLSLADRTTVLQSWAHSRFFVRRKAFQGLKRLALFIAYSNLTDNQPHPIWDPIGYPANPNADADPQPRPIKPIMTDPDDILETDVLIIGSGAGGGVVAGELTANGHDVIVIEKGGYYTESDFDGNEAKANETLFEHYGALTSVDTSIMILAGATFGGGTTVNWSGSFRTPPHVLREWHQRYGFTSATSPQFQQSLDAVIERLNVNTDESAMNGNNQMLARGCQALEYDLQVIPRNVKGCEDCGFCGYGCPYGAKQSTARTYLQDAYDRGARMIVNATAERITYDHGQATGAVITVTPDDRAPHQITVRAKAVVVSAGAIHTPAILLRSGLINPNIGRHLRLHPTTAVFSLFDEPVRSWEGVPMSRVSKQFADLDGRGYGVILETAPTHPGLYGLAYPWTSGREHKHLIQQTDHVANIIVLTRDAYGGRIVIDDAGQPKVHYRLHDYDAKHALEGIIAAIKIHEAASAREVVAPYNDHLSYQRKHGKPAFNRFIDDVQRRGLPANAFPLFSAHQMASCRISGSPRLGAIKPTGETWDVQNLFVADASALPTASGVNPMITIMAVSHHIAGHIHATLK